MKRMKLKSKFIDIVGIWDGSEDGEVAQWLTDNGYKFQVQVEDAQQVSWRGAKEGDEPRKQLAIIGKRMYDDTALAVGNLLILAEGRLSAYDTDQLNEHYEDI